MGRRSRQRASAPQRERTPAPPAAPAPRAAVPQRPTAPPTTTAIRRSRPRARAAAPQAPWGSFPLVELCALAAIVFGVWGIVAHNGVLLLGAAGLGSVAGLEVALREHLGGYRSHTFVLSALCAVVTLTVLAFANADRTAMLAGAAAVLVAGLVGFRQLFKRRSGGVGLRVR